RDAVPMLLAGQLPGSDEIMFPGNSDKCLFALLEFNRLMLVLNAQPTAHITYIREAYQNDSNTLRITFDRQVFVDKETEPHLHITMHDPQSVWGDQVVLEVKFTERFPTWFKDLIRRFELVNTGAPKYCDGIEMIKGWWRNNDRIMTGKEQSIGLFGNITPAQSKAFKGLLSEGGVNLEPISAFNQSYRDTSVKFYEAAFAGRAPPLFPKDFVIPVYDQESGMLKIIFSWHTRKLLEEKISRRPKILHLLLQFIFLHEFKETIEHKPHLQADAETKEAFLKSYP
ncbi:MAG: VTC domain-containing protein, partial [Candidatus Omnitrophica bacterium]|nr:VTC domain-containing protein [Candidatus Omnitrophota bacterium]